MPAAPVCGPWPIDDAAPARSCHGAEADLCLCAFARTTNSSCIVTTISSVSSFSLVSAPMPKVAAESSEAAADIAAAGRGKDDSNWIYSRTAYQPQPHQETTPDNLTNDSHGRRTRAARSSRTPGPARARARRFGGAGYGLRGRRYPKSPHSLTGSAPGPDWAPATMARRSRRQHAPADPGRLCADKWAIARSTITPADGRARNKP